MSDGADRAQTLIHTPSQVKRTPAVPAAVLLIPKTVLEGTRKKHEGWK